MRKLLSMHDVNCANNALTEAPISPYFGIKIRLAATHTTAPIIVLYKLTLDLPSFNIHKLCAMPMFIKIFTNAIIDKTTDPASYLAPKSIETI